MTIGKKLYVGFGSILAILFLLFLLNTASVLRERSSRTDAANALESVRTVEAVRFQIMQNRSNLGSFLLSGDPRDEEKVNKGIAELFDLLKKKETKSGNESLRTGLIEVEGTEKKWADEFVRPVLAKRHQVDSGDATASDLQIFYLQKDPNAWVNPSAGVLDQINGEISRALQESSDSAARWTTINTIVTFLGTLLAIFAGMAIAYYTAKSISDPLGHLITVAREIGDSGDLDQNIDIHRNDKIGALATTFNNMVSYLKEMATVSASIAEGELAVEIAPRSKRDTLGNAFVRMSHGLRDLVRQVRDSASQVSAGSNQVAGASDESAKVSVQASAEIIGVLGRRADDIGKIIEVIDDLAEQTNLLALNAAIEAARAGEHGLGFAVVADEVRKLAEKSTQSTKEISELISSIQKEARQAVENMQHSTRIVEEGLSLGSDLNTALGKISNVVTEVFKFAQEIGAATNEQSVGSSQIAKATSRLTEITQEINSAVEEQASGAQAVVRAMEKMRELVQQSASGSTELSAAAEQMLKLSRMLLESMDRFVLERMHGIGDPRRAPGRRDPEGARLSPEEYAEVGRS